MTRRRSRAGRGRAGLAGVLGLVGLSVGVATGCSTLAPPPSEQECATNDDCPGEQFCDLAQGGRCIDPSAPRQASLALAMIDGEFRAEFYGCDAEVRPSANSFELRVRRNEFERELALAADMERATVSCNEFSGCPGSQCVGGTTCIRPWHSEISASRMSRLGLSELSSPTKVYGEPVEDDPEVDADETPELFFWASYAEEDPVAGAPVVFVADPASGTEASVFRAAIEPVDADFPITTAFECHRVLVGSAQVLETETPIAGAQVTMRYGEPIAAPETVLPEGAAPPCDTDDECDAPLRCNLDRQTCGLDLEGELAGTDESGENGTFGVWVYTYCQDAQVSDLDLTARLTPSLESGLPQINYRYAQGFNPVGIGEPVPDDPVEGTMCVPDWPAAQSIEFTAQAPPVSLFPELEAGQGWSCCDLGCLPGSGMLDTPPVVPEACTTNEQIRFEASVPAPDIDEWDGAGCLPYDEDEDGSIGRFTRSATCAGESGLCEARLVPGSEEAREYQVTITQPVGSVFRSQRLTVELDPADPSIDTMDYAPRTILSGQVACDEGLEDCAPSGASIVAERLREDGETALAPFIFSTRSLVDGSFVLPVNPGRYIVTALPSSQQGTGSGPAPYYIVDARIEASGVVFENGAPRRELDPIVLQSGQTVRVRATGFPFGARLIPYDVGSWKAQGPDSDTPEIDVDLTDPQTCYGSNGCLIRRLADLDSNGVPVLQGGQSQFTTRNRGARSCE